MTNPQPSKFSFKPVGAAPAPATPVSSPDQNKAADVAKTVAPAAPASTVASPAPTPAAQTGTVATVQPANAAMTEYRPPASYGDDSEELGANDVIIPRLNIVQKVGDLSNQFTEGDLVLNQQLVIARSVKGRQGTPAAAGSPPTAAAQETVRVVVAGFRKDRYVEKTDGSVRGDIVDSEAEVYAKGGTTNYNEAKQLGKKLYQTLAECVLLIEKPADCQDETSFPYTADGKQYAVVKWSLKGGAYINGAKVLRTARKAGWLADLVNTATGEIKEKRGYHCGFWKLGTVLKGYDTGNFSWNPQLVRDGDTGEGVRALALQVIQN